ncbi:MAG: hypothetical protein JNK16_02975, partial [Phycisphaerales bacterium]|nr:hypothetical protein [Phycisphaerales bacterium]
PPQSPPELPLFNPSPTDAAQIIDDLADPYSTFASIAKAHNTTLEGLTLWMQRPDIAGRLDAVESASTRRNRLLATNHLPICIDALSRAVNASAYEDTHTVYPEGSMKHDEQRRRGRETLIRMTRVMMQLAKTHPAQVAARRPESAPPPTPPSGPRLANPFVAPGSDSSTSARASAVPVSLTVERSEGPSSNRKVGHARAESEPQHESHAQMCCERETCSCGSASD